MRILHVIPSLAARGGGPAKAVLELCNALIDSGHYAEIYSTDADIDGPADVPLNKQVLVGQVPVTYFKATRSRYYKISLAMAIALKRNVARYDIVHAHALYQSSSTIAAINSRHNRIAYVVTPHGSLDPFLFRRHRARKWLYEFAFERRNLRAAAAVHFTSTEEMELARLSGLRFRGLIAPLGVELEKAPDDWEGRVNTTWPDLVGKEIILFLGRINFKKGLDVLARAFSTIHGQRKDAQLVIAGPDNDGYGKQVREWLAQENCLAGVTFTGMVQGGLKASLLRRARVFALPSYTENFGIAVVEAMGVGLPVAISNRVNIWREVQEAGAGLVSNPDPDQFAQILLAILNDQAAARDMGQQGYRLAHERFSWQVAGEDILQLYKQALCR